MLTRRNFLSGLIVMPAIVKYQNIMPVRRYPWYKGSSPFDSAFFYAPYIPLDFNKTCFTLDNLNSNISLIGRGYYDSKYGG